MPSSNPQIQTFSFSIDEEDADQRLDVFLADQDEPPLSRSQVKKFLDRGDITVNGQHLKAGHSLRAGDLVEWRYESPTPLSTRPQPIDVEILHADEDIVLVNKPAGLVVHPAPGHPDSTLVNALRHRFETLSTLGGELRPGIVHRLDRDTSGVLAVARTDRAHQTLAAQFKAHSAERIYHAIVFGPGLPDGGTFSTRHGRHPTQRMRFTGAQGPRHAVTHFKVLERFSSGPCLVACTLETGRTHQIRMHFAEADAPILGDHLYGGRATSQVAIIPRQALHAVLLRVDHPDGHAVGADAPYPEDFRVALEDLRRGKNWR